MFLKFHTRVAKWLKLKVRKFWRLIPTFVEVTWEKLVGVGGNPLSILDRVKFASFWSIDILLVVAVTMIPSLTHYSPVLPFYPLWKLQKTFRFSDVFRGYKKATLGCNGLLSLQYLFSNQNYSFMYKLFLPVYLRLAALFWWFYCPTRSLLSCLLFGVW